MTNALVIGGTRFIGRHLVTELVESGYEVTLFNRGNHDNPFSDDDRVDHVKGDRTSSAMLDEAAEAVEPSVVVDCVAYHPGEVRMATNIFDDVDAYVYISSGAAYGTDEIPKREGETALESCTDEEAVDDSWETYGARKAEGDRAVFEAAEQGVRAMSVRPVIVYGAHDYTGRFEYWVDRVRTQHRILVPGDGTNLQHLVAVENVVRAILTVIENGTAGEAYNVGDRTSLPLGPIVETIADILDRDIEIVTASERELATAELSPRDFPLYNPTPHLLTTQKLVNIGWDPISPTEGFRRAIDGPVEPERDPGPDRETTATILEELD